MSEETGTQVTGLHPRQGTYILQREWRNWDSSYWSKTRYVHHTERVEKLGLDLLVQDEVHVRNSYKEGYYGNKPLDEEKNNGEKICTYNNLSYLHVHTV